MDRQRRAHSEPDKMRGDVGMQQAPLSNSLAAPATFLQESESVCASPPSRTVSDGPAATFAQKQKRARLCFCGRNADLELNRGWLGRGRGLAVQQHFLQL